jgi:hypothetical protein
METIDTDFHIFDKIQEANDPSGFFKDQLPHKLVVGRSVLHLTSRAAAASSGS